MYPLDLSDGRGSLGIGAYGRSGIRASGVAEGRELESRIDLRFHLRDGLVLSSCDDGSALAFQSWESGRRER
jgi:hypothetical protein